MNNFFQNYDFLLLNITGFQTKCFLPAVFAIVLIFRVYFLLHYYSWNLNKCLPFYNDRELLIEKTIDFHCRFVLNKFSEQQVEIDPNFIAGYEYN